MSESKYFNPVPMFILFREAIEASIVVSVLLTFVSRSVPALKAQIWWGVACGVGISLLLGMVFAILYYTAQKNLFQGKSQFIFKGVVCWIACIFITYLAFAMLRYKGWEEKWARKLKTQGVQKLVESAAEPPPGTALEEVQIQVSAPSQGQAEAATVTDTKCPGGLGTPRSSTSVTSKLAATPLTTGQDHAGYSASLDNPRPSLDNRRASTSSTLKLIPNHDSAKAESALVPHPASSSPTLDDCAGNDVDSSVPAAPALSWHQRLRAWSSMLSSQYSLFIVVFFTVLREGLESVVFLFGVGNAEPSAIPISGLIGILCGVLVGVLLYYSGKQVKDIKWLLIAFATVLFFIAAGAFENGAGYLMMGGMFGPYVPPQTMQTMTSVGGITSLLYGTDGRPPAPSADNGGAAAAFNDGDEIVVVTTASLNDGYIYVMTPPQPWWQAPLWDISSCCGDTDEKNKFLSMCKNIFGYNAMPTFIHAIFYLGYWVFVLCWAMWKWDQGTLFDADYKYKRMLRKQKEQALQDKLDALNSGEECAYSSKQGDLELTPAKELEEGLTAK